MKHILKYSISGLIGLCIYLVNTEVYAMQDDTTQVEIAFGRQHASRVVGAMSTISGEEISDLLGTNMATLLNGRLTGLAILPQRFESGLAAPTIIGRGVATFTGSNTPLVMVDGFEGDFEQLVAEEIATISFLKDASATALYGMRGANGVLLVTTKRGLNQPLRVNFNTKVGMHTPFFQPKFLGASQYATLYNEALANDGLPAQYSAEEIAAYTNGTDPYFYPDVDWYGQVLRPTAPFSSHNLSFRGGGENVRYFGMLNMISDGSLLKPTEPLSENSINSRYRRYNFRTNIDVMLTKNLEATLWLGGSVEDKQNPMANETASLFNRISIIAPNQFPVFNPDGSYGGNSLFTNPWADMLETGMYTSNGRTIQSALQLRQSLDMVTPGLEISSSVAFNNYFTNFSDKSRTYARFALARDNAGEANYIQFGQNTSLVGSENESNQWRNVGVRGFINYDRGFGQHQVDAMVMGTYDNYTISGQAYPVKHIGLGGRANYAFDDRYLVDVSFSYMGTDNFAPGNRYGFFPAIGAGWILSNESFMDSQGGINFLKLRANYGLVGNSAIGGDRFMFDQIYRYSSAYHFGTGNTSTSSIEEGQIANPNVTWEKDKMFNVGVDAAFANNRLSVTADYFFNKRHDILANPYRDIPGYFGMDLPLLNVGQVNYQGVESGVTFSSHSGRAFQYAIYAHVSYAKNVIQEMSEALTEYGYQAATGRRIGQPFGLEAVGFFRDEADIANSPLHAFTPVVPGDIKYKDQNNDGIVNDADFVPIGNPRDPMLMFSIYPKISYKGFDLGVLLNGVSGRSVYRSGLAYHAFQNEGKVAENALGRWTPATAEQATYPRLSSTDNLNNYRYSSFWQRNGNFLKVRNVELGYVIPKIGPSIGVRQARVFFNGNNLLSFDSLGGEDPESNMTTPMYPAVRTFLLGVSVDF